MIFQLFSMIFGDRDRDEGTQGNDEALQHYNAHSSQKSLLQKVNACGFYSISYSCFISKLLPSSHWLDDQTSFILHDLMFYRGAKRRGIREEEWEQRGVEGGRGKGVGVQGPKNRSNETKNQKFYSSRLCPINRSNKSACETDTK